MPYRMNRYKFTLGRWYFSPDGGVSWHRTRYSQEWVAPATYRDRNPKIDLFSDAGRYLCSTNHHATCKAAFAWYAVNRPEMGVTVAQRSRK